MSLDDEPGRRALEHVLGPPAEAERAGERTRKVGGCTGQSGVSLAPLRARGAGPGG